MDNNKNWFQKAGGLEGIIIIALILFSLLAMIKYAGGIFLGKKEIGSFFEAKKPYTARYYVYLFGENNNAKNYKLPADITVDTESDGETGFTTIRLEKAYFPNGGFLTFSNCLLEGKKNIADQCQDQNGVNWTIEFKKEKIN